MPWLVVSNDSEMSPAIRTDEEIMSAHWPYELSIKDRVIAAGSLRPWRRAFCVLGRFSRRRLVHFAKEQCDERRHVVMRLGYIKYGCVFRAAGNCRC